MVRHLVDPHLRSELTMQKLVWAEADTLYQEHWKRGWRFDLVAGLAVCTSLQLCITVVLVSACCLESDMSVAVA